MRPCLGQSSKSFFIGLLSIKVYGAAEVYNKIREKTDSADGNAGDEGKAKSPKLPEDWSIELEEDFLVFSHEDYWKIWVPYYFQVKRLKRTEQPKGTQAEIITFKTGFMKHVGHSGASRGTILFVRSPLKTNQDMKDFRAYWHKKVHRGRKTVQTEVPATKLKSEKSLNKSAGLHVESTLFRVKKSGYAVIYTAENGPYQWNRAHYIDFLREIELKK